jgi:hypothetical protein
MGGPTQHEYGSPQPAPVGAGELGCAVGKSRPGWGQVGVLYLEPKRAAATVGYAFMALVTLAVATAAVTYRTSTWPANWRPQTEIPDRAVLITAAVAGVLALVLFAAAIVNGRRWHTARAVERLSEDPTLASYLPDTTALSPPGRRAPVRPPLEVTFVKPRKLPKPGANLRQVTAERNIVGHRPLQIAYLRLFENQPRTRTFVEGAWREFGYVHLLRSAASVTPAEYRWSKRSGDLSGMFIRSREQLIAAIGRRRDQPIRKGRYKFKNVNATTIKVRDPYGSYPLRALLCHGSFWKAAVDELLERVDLVALDLSGFTAKHLGTRYELQRVVDRFPIERVVFLADERSNRKFLDDQLRQTWFQMAEGSPNAGPASRLAVIVITDYYAQSQQQGDTSQVQVRLAARRSQTRRVVAMAQDRLDRLRLVGSVGSVGSGGSTGSTGVA